MKVDEQATFATAKRKELKFFFDNLVWQFCAEINQERTTNARFILKWRTMNARFILKWRTGAAGQQEA